jgi:23S rRNA (adenine1618-N6)-methyltransferase
MAKTKSGSRLHPRNRNRERYDLGTLVEAVPELKEHIVPNRMGEDSVDFANPKAVKLLNTALLKSDYGLDYWEFPDENLCPPIPGRADYIHYMAGLLQECFFGKLPAGEDITCLDIGTGASCIYPILGVIEYNWNFIATDVDPDSMNSAQNIVLKNPQLKGKVSCKLQHKSKDIFYGILRKEDKVDLVVCNPPFHSSIEDARKGTARKVKNLTGKAAKNASSNFSGNVTELVYPGGEYKFIHNMIRESEKFYQNCFWFSTLVSKQSNLKGIYKTLRKFGAVDVRTIPLGTGNKSSRIVAWTYLSKEERKDWRKERWE